MNDTLLKVSGLKKVFPAKASAFSTRTLDLRAVDGVSLDLKRGETLGLVGESGCGKTTVGRCVLRLYEPNAKRVFLDPDDRIVAQVTELDEEAAELIGELDAFGSQPTKTSADRRRIRSLRHTADRKKRDADRLARDSDLLCMDRSRLKQARRRMQMVFQDPWASLIVCDEPVGALDVSIQAQILNLLISLQDDFDLTFIFIAHDLSVVQYISDRVAVMYLGKIVETSEASALYANPRHPYTISLLSAVSAQHRHLQPGDPRAGQGAGRSRDRLPQPAQRMIRLRSRISVSRARDHRLIVQSSVSRRTLFGGIALLLLVSFIVSVNWARGIDDGLVVGTVFYFAVTAICLAVAGWNVKLVLDRNQGAICVTRSLFAIAFSRRNLSLSQVRAIVLRRVRFLRESEQPRDALLSTRFQGYMERRMHYNKLHLETDDQLHLVGLHRPGRAGGDGNRTRRLSLGSVPAGRAVGSVRGARSEHVRWCPPVSPPRSRSGLPTGPGRNRTVLPS